MYLVPLVVGVSLATVIVLTRLWWVLRDRSRRRRAQSWNRSWAAYRLRLPIILMARWPKGRLLTHRSNPNA